MYITNSDVISALGGTAKAAQYTTESGSSPDTDLIDSYIARAEGRINSAVQTRTATTISASLHPQTFAMLQGFAVAISRYQIALRRGKVPEDWKAPNKEAVDWLNGLAEGKRDFPDAVLNATTCGSGSYRETASPESML